MKTFSEKEQRILKYIVRNRHSHTFILANVFNEWFDESGISFNLQTGEMIYDFNSSIDADKILSDEHGIVEVALLIKYLVDKGYIYVIKDSKGEIDIKKIGKNFSSANIFHTLPKDIVKIIKQSLYRVFVANDLVEFVDNKFQSIETQQMMLAISQLNKAHQQLDIAQKQLTEVKAQTNELQKQTNEIHEQTSKVQQQLEEAKSQTKYAREQSEENKKQTISAQKQTKLSWGALVCAIVTVIVSIIVPIILNTYSDEEEYHNNILQKLIQANTLIIQSRDDLNNDADSIISIGTTIVNQNNKMIKMENQQNQQLRQIFNNSNK